MADLAQQRSQRKKTTKKKKKKVLDLKKWPIPFESAGIILIILAIFGMGQFGFVGRFLFEMSVVLAGTFAGVLLILIGLLGIHFIVKRKWPALLKPHFLGVFFMLFAIMVIYHTAIVQPLLFGDLSVMQVSNQLVNNYRLETISLVSVGGGYITALLVTLTYFLFAAVGTYILATLLFIEGVFLVTDHSPREVLNWLVAKISQKIKAYKEKKPKVKKTVERQSVKESEEIEPEPAKNVAYEPPRIKSFNEGKQMPDLRAEVLGNAAKPQPITELAKEVPENDDPVIGNTPDVVPFTAPLIDTSYELPSTTLLNPTKFVDQSDEKRQINENAKILEATFKSFGVDAKVTEVHLGPAVTEYEVQPAVGVKVSKVVSLTDDIALALAAKEVRIQAPIPGKSVIGIEVPNKNVAMVTLREILEDNPQNIPSEKLQIALGRDISGEAVMAKLNKMPHLLVAGATGSGKSVCINSIITSILLKAKPHEVKMMLIDPKMVELSVYNGVPHLLTPVVTNPKKAAQALQKVVAEMERRYDLFSHYGTRNIEGYNQIVAENNETESVKQTPLPYIVTIVDELADLMLVASNDVESAIMRITQMGRASGIHMIVATQRPSVDVITGVIKANIPARISFAVSSAIDSRTILDMSGGEKLLGMGDMLFKTADSSKPTRIQGAFLSDQEVETIVDACIEQQKAQYQEEMIPDEIDTNQAEPDDELFDEAVQMFVQQQAASVSMLQRKFKVGYNRAARIVDEMENRGIVGPHEGSKPRRVNVTEWPIQESE
ncbi:DNA translocase FtsK [Brochothrix thermosphacta]|uniref:DNA translocase FtsK n=1 Tax=Brochothrix thermosphacta TaxID=2756 RepID=UPI002877F584|nr:DNA translocase FtsK [Brochothrix thermosphacta]